MGVKKVFVFGLVCFLLTFLSVSNLVYAEDFGVPTESSGEIPVEISGESSETEGEAAPETSTESEPEPGTIEPLSHTTSLPFSEATGLSASALQLLQGFCRNCSLTQSNGALAYQYALQFPAGRNGLNPQISLSYSQLDSDPATLLATGWQLNYGGYISRSENKGLNDMYELNEFYVSVGGQGGKLVPIDLSDSTHGIYGLETEQGFWKYEFLADNSWRITDTTGTIYTLGSSSSSRQDDPADSDRIYKWMLERVEDRNGNYMTFEYLKNAGQIYPKTIDYTGHGSDNGKYEILFEPFASFAEDTPAMRSDKSVSYRTGFKVETRYSLQSVELVIDGEMDEHARKRYNFSSVQRNNSTLRSLAHIEESFWDGSDWHSLPRTEFTYEQRATGWTYNSSYWGNLTYDSVGADINADGLEDLLYSQSGNGRSLQLNNGETGVTNITDLSEWEFGDFALSYYHSAPPPIAADINNDGLTDFIVYSSGSSGSSVYLHNGVNGWELASGTWNVPFEFTNPGWHTVDINADGLLDWVNINGANRSVYIHNGVNGWDYQNPLNWPSVYSVGEHYVPLDINNDGLQDFVYKLATTSVMLHNGINGWVLADSNDFEIPVEIRSEYSPRIADANADGLMDFVYYNSDPATRRVYLNNGVNGWEDAGNGITWQIPGEFATHANKFMDVNNDGYFDFVDADSSPQTVYLSNRHSAYLLTAIDNNMGGEIEISYKNAKSFKDGSEFNNPDLLRDFMLVHEIKNYDRGNLKESQTFSYSGGEFLLEDISDPYSRLFAGFHKVQTTDSEGNYTLEYFHQGGGVDGSEQGEYLDHKSKRGNLYRSETYDNSGQLYSAGIYKYESVDLGDGRFAPQLTRKTDITYDGDSDSRVRAVEYTYDAYGNVLSETDFGEVSLSDETGNFSDIGSDKIFSSYEYALNEDDHILALPKRSEVRDQANNLVSQTRTYYDDLSLGNVDLGNPTKVEQFVTAGTYIDSEFDYNSYGLVTASTNPRNYITTVTYDSENLFPVTVTNAKNHVTTYTYDYLTGVALTVTDANNAQTVTTLDDFGRPLSVAVSNPSSPTTTTTRTTYSYDLENLPTSTSVTNYTGGGASNLTVTYFDGFKRPIQTRTQTEGTDQFIVKNTVYDERGLTEKELLPLIETGSAFTSINFSGIGTTYTYDVLKRPLSVTNTLGTTSTVYDDWRSTVTDARSVSKDLTFDARGRLITVTEHLGTSSLDTNYSYNAAGNLLNITDSLGNTKNFTYDLLGRMLTEEDFHTPAGTFGLTTFVYDANGNATRRTDQSGQIINWTYDQLDRVTTENNPSVSGTEVIYTYDTATNGRGKISSISQLGGNSESYNYDILGRVTDTRRQIESSPYYRVYFTHDLLGNVTTMNYAAHAFTYEYDSVGLLERVRRGTSNIVSNISYAPNGAIASYTYGNGTVTTNTYDINQMYLLTRKLVQSGSSNIQDISYTFDAIGNITRLVDASSTGAAKTVDYTYDDLSRLTSATSSGAASGSNYSHTYTYSPIGNIENFAGTLYTYTSSDPHKATAVGSQSLTYDSRGNLTSHNGSTYTWDYRGQMATATTAQVTETYKYDFAGNRSKKSDNVGNTTLYISDEYELRNGIRHAYIFAAGMKVATVSGNSTSTLVTTYHHADHLSGSNVDTNASGAVIQTLDYFPYGETRLNIRTGSYNNPKKFTGKERDGESGLYYYGARYYNAAIGRFISRDAWSGELTDPQSLNKYSYVLNNPMKYVDPTGNWTFLAVAAEVAAEKFIEVAVYVAGAYIYNEVKEDFFNETPSVQPQADEGILATPSLPKQTQTPTVIPPTQVNNQPLITPSSPNLNVNQTVITADDVMNHINFVFSGDGKEHKVPKSGLSGKEGKKDIPSWAKGERPYVDESGKDFAKRLLDEKYGPDNYPKGPKTEHNELKKYGDNNFEIK